MAELLGTPHRLPGGRCPGPPTGPRGPLDPGTDAANPSFGHLWTIDVPSGFCRIIPGVTDPAIGAVTPAFLDRNTPGGKAGQPVLDPRRKADGTFYAAVPM
jgi:hypothetical protein